MSKWLAFFPALFCVYSSAPAFEIKGIHVDRPADCPYIFSIGKEVGPGSNHCEKRTKIWQLQVSFLSGQTSMLLHQTPQGIIRAIQLSGFNFQEAVDALTVKYGAPQLENSTVRNAYGATFQQTEATWKQGVETLYVARHGPTLGKSGLFLSGNVFSSSSSEESEKKAAKNAGNL